MTESSHPPHTTAPKHACTTYPAWCVGVEPGHRRHIGDFVQLGDAWHVVIQAERIGSEPRVEIGRYGDPLVLLTAEEARQVAVAMVEQADVLTGREG